ncbi:hypothetical protein BRD17_07005 [Halobacteriales archaeon SW_7_68_16]|nr:MAG: hypothetical protein BRD17_07005 [Halobacteriales archaeon SW_7_68_16]
MRVRDWDDIVAEVASGEVDPDGWRAIAGDRADGVGEDLYLGHPAAGLYHLKTYARNPFDVDGVGTKVARRLDDEIGGYLPEEGGRFAVQSPPEDESAARRAAGRLETVVETHAGTPTDPEALFDDLMRALDSPAFGPMAYDAYDRPGSLDDLAAAFEEAETVLSTELDELIDEDGVGRGFR